MTPGALFVVTLAVALLSACYEMPLIPENSVSLAGSGGRGAGAQAGAGTGSGGMSGNSGASHTDGGAKPNGVGGANAGSGGKGGGTAGASAHAGSSGASPTTWLALDGSTAPSSSAINAALGIEGVFYAYGDGCAKLNWDPAGRCASGKLCPPGPDVWGISIGFDFHNTGPNGTPADTKLTWNPETHGARGVAWRIHENAPKLEVWVLNMDSAWQGQCSGMPCEIDGPPDGVSPAALAGELRFDDMIKDTWGSGVEYTFDPEAVHALQFKIASVKVGAAEFDFCIDALGIVR